MDEEFVTEVDFTINEVKFLFTSLCLLLYLAEANYSTSETP